MNPRVLPFFYSTLAHTILLLFFALLFSRNAKQFVENVEFAVIEHPKQGVSPALRLEPIKPAPPKPVEKGGRSVFGLSKNTLHEATAGLSQEGVTIKEGNTIAIAPDDKKLNDNDPSSLPIPTEEYLVTEMPRLTSEIRIPYPKEARAKGIEGPVVMDVLIDTSGIVREVKLLDGPGGGLNEAALEAVKRLVFKPAKVDERPVAVRIRYTYRFVLEKS